MYVKKSQYLQRKANFIRYLYVLWYLFASTLVGIYAYQEYWPAVSFAVAAVLISMALALK